MHRGPQWFLIRWVQGGEVREESARGIAEIQEWLKEIDEANAELLVVCSTRRFTISA